MVQNVALETQIRSLSPFLNPRSRLGLQTGFMEEVSVRLKLFPVKFLGVMNSRWSSDIIWRLNYKNTFHTRYAFV